MLTGRNFATILKELRRQRGLTQEDIAQATGRSVDAVSQWERGVNSPSYETLLLICRALAVSPSALFDWPANPQSEDRLKQEATARALISNLSNADLAIAIEQLQAFRKRK